MAGAARTAAIGAMSLALVAPVAPRGCGAVVREAESIGVECASELVYGECVGVPARRLCAEDTCTQGVDCDSVVIVSGEAELADAMASAAPGDCIAAAPGDYPEVELPGGVSLLGGGADVVRFAGVSMALGAGATLRGVEVGEGGVRVAAGASVDIDSVRSLGSSDHGVDVGEGASARISRTTVTGSAGAGVAAFDAASVSIERSLVEGAEQGGVWGACADGCACAAPGSLDLSLVLVRDARRVGVAVTGVPASLDRVVVADSTADASFEAGFGVVASECADLDARALTVSGSAVQGVLVDGAAASIGSGAPGEEVIVDGNAGGVWIQHVSTADAQQVRLQGVRISGSKGVGLGISGHSTGVFLRDVRVADTTMLTLPSSEGGVGGSVEVGDGVVWLDRSFADVDGLVVSGSARASFLIDGEVAAGSRIASVTLGPGDADKGIVQQRCPSWGSTPEVGAGAPPIDVTDKELFPVPWD